VFDLRAQPDTGLLLKKDVLDPLAVPDGSRHEGLGAPPPIEAQCDRPGVSAEALGFG
jgi:hypothetical protein